MGLGPVRSVETLRFLLPYLETTLAEPASKSIVELARHKELREPNKQEFGAALDTGDQDQHRPRHAG